MRVPRSRAPAFLSTAALLAGLAGLAVAAEVRAAPAPAADATAGTVSAAAPAAGPDDTVGASCRTLVQGSLVTAHCQNPYPRTDRVRLHVECDRWWDVDTDSAPVEVGPADYAQVTARCWKEVRSAWITHEPAAQGS
ncbi:hypothetical protein ACGF1Z_05925 [Streptomyces sp. NPDC048018]|uniref:hypothetical protein n=1 Tax=Streptomyces sp. NPDC048018 TaxID=3365499 RepID=UPI003715791D